MPRRDSDINKREIIIALDGQEIDITWQILELRQIGRGHCPDSEPFGWEKRLIHRTGWGLIRLCGAEAAIDLVDELEEDGEISEPFADHLRERWERIARLIQEAEAAD